MIEAKCFCCHKVVKQRDEDQEFSLDGGLWFSSRGGWPSTVFDPRVYTGFSSNRWDELRIFICEECLRARKKEIAYVQATRKVEIEHEVDNWDHHDEEMKKQVNETYPNREAVKP